MTQITGGPHRGHAAGSTDAEKQASQLVSDIKYKVSLEMKKKGGASKLSPAQVSQEYMKKWKISPAPPQVKKIAKEKLMAVVREQYTEEVKIETKKLAEKSIVSALHQVFTEDVSSEKEWIVVTDKKTGNTYRRQATREKIAELRANPNISRVEITSYHPDEDDDKKGQKTAKVKSGQGLAKKDYDGDGKIESPKDEVWGSRAKAAAKAGRPFREEFIGEVKNQEKDDKKKITGQGVNNYEGGKDAVVKVFPDSVDGVKEEVSTQSIQSKDSASSQDQKRQLSTLQQFQRKEYQLNQQKLAAQKQGKIPVGSVQMDSYEPEGEDVQEVAPPGMEKTVRGMKKHPELSTGKTPEGKEKNIYALAWYMYNKKKRVKEECECEDEQEPKLKKSEGAVDDPREIPTKVNLVKNKFRAMGLKMSYEPEGEMVDEAQAMGSVRSGDQNPKGAAVRVSSGRGMTMTPARGLGASKPAGDDAARAARQKAQAKADRVAAAKDRAASGEDRLGRLIKSVQKSHYEPQGEMLGEGPEDRMQDERLMRGGIGAGRGGSSRPSQPSKPMSAAEREAANKKHQETSRKAIAMVMAKHGGPKNFM